MRVVPIDTVDELKTMDEQDTCMLQLGMSTEERARVAAWRGSS